MTSGDLAALAGLALTDDEVGATAEMPTADLGVLAGYHHVHVSARIGSGRARFEQAGEAVMHHGMLRGAGARVTASTEVAEVGTLVVSRLGPISAPCRVVYTLDEPNRRRSPARAPAGAAWAARSRRWFSGS